jgi:hypothetical protein
LTRLWPAFQAFASTHKDTVEFHFWGIDPADYAALACPVHFKPFTHVYESYLFNLSVSTFDVVVMPLDDATRAARSKSPVKLLESVVSGAVCIFSDVPPYSDLPDDCCLKTANTTEAWAAMLSKVYAMGENGRNTLLEKARTLVMAKYTTESQYYDFLSAFMAVQLHSRLGSKTIAYVFHEPALGGATLHLLRHASLIQSMGFRVVGLVQSEEKHQDAFEARWEIATAGAPLFSEHWAGGCLDSELPDQIIYRPGSEFDETAATHLARRL